MGMSKRKKYNPVKRIQKMSSTVTKGLAIGFIGGGDKGGCFVIDIKRKKQVKVSATLADAFGRVPHQWSMIQAIFCRRQDGTRIREVPAGANLCKVLRERP